MLISMIVAVSSNQVIGYNNQLPWHLPRDLQYFKKVTSNHCVIMGRKTYESIGKALPNRHNIVISRNKNYLLTDATVCNDLTSALNLATNLLANQHNNDELTNVNDEIFIIGGASLFNQALAIADKVYLNKVLAEFVGDTFFPILDDKWQLISSEKHIADAKNVYDLQFEVYQRTCIA